MWNKFAGGFILLSAAVLLAGCGGGEATGRTEPTSEPSSGNLHGAPKVQNPLDTASFHGKPCTVLTPEQREGLGVAAAGKADLDRTFGPGCTWNDRFTGSSDSRTSVTFGVNGDGLKVSYAKKGTYGYFRELQPAQGFPAIAAGTTGGASPEQEGECGVLVGTSNDLAVLTQITLGDTSPYQGDPCGRARAVATEVVRTLQGSA